MGQPSGDSIDAELPDGTRVVSTSTTLNGQTTVTAQLLDKDGNVLLSAGAGQTMERDPETGIVQVRTGDNDLVRQYNPETGEVTNELRSGSDAAAVYESLVDAFQNPQLPTAEGVQVADASDHTDTGVVSDAGTGAPNPSTPEVDTPITRTQADAGVSMFNAVMAASQHWGQMDDVQRAAVLGQMYMAGNQMSGGATSLGDGTNAALSGLNFINALEHGQTLQALQGGLQLTQAGLSMYSQNMTDAANAMMEEMMSSSTVTAAESAAFDAAAESAAESAAASNTLGEAVPYVAAAIALKNFADNPEQAAVTYACMYAGEIIGGAFGGPVGAVIGGAIGGMIGASLGSALGDDLPAPEGSVHFGWDTNGQIEYHVTYEQSGGGSAASGVAASIQNMLQSVVDAHNAQNPSSADDIAINPYCLPAVHFKADWGGATVEIATSDGHTATHNLNDPNFGQWLVQTMLDTGGIAPAWQVQTVAAHVQAQRAAGVDEAAIAAEAGITATVGAHAGDAAYSAQGNAAQSADFKSQTFGALVVHLNDNPQAQAAQTQLTQVLRDVEDDGYFEQTQTVAAKDSAGNLQAVLTIDFNGDGVVQTRDILNLGGNTGESLSASGQLANEHADQQRNNMQWLDANGDGVLDKSDPAFAAIKLWVDVNQDGSQQGNEAASLQSMHISSINFKTGEVTYDDGHTDALTAQTLKADTEGVKLTQMMHTDAQGHNVEVNAGVILEHEGYQGQQQVTDITGTHWQQVRSQTYEQQALRTGDWEGTAEQDAHRHGGGNVEGAPTQTTATGATSQGEVKTQDNVITQSTLEEGDERVVSDAPTQATTAQANAQTTVGAGDSRIKSNAAPATTTNTAPNTANTNPRPADTRIVFVLTTQSDSVQNQIQAVTDSMIESAQNTMFSASANAGLGVLAAFSAGATQSAQAAQAAAVQRPAVQSDAPSTEVAQVPSVQPTTSSTNSFSSTPLNTLTSTDTNTPQIVFKQVDLGVFTVPPVAQTNPAATPSTEPTFATNPATSSPSPATGVQATVVVNPPVTTPTAETTSTKTPPATATASEPQPAVHAALTLDYPVVQGETLAGTEDVVLRLNQSVLLANDSTPNASADPSQPALTITAVSAPVNGQVSLVDGEVFFLPDANFHGTASFTYTVTDQYGLSTTGTATLNIAAVNDAPVTQGEAATTAEDTAIVFTQAELLANDTDVDIATDGQVLRISAVSGATHGHVTLLANGDIRFVPDANYHGPAEFSYTVSDGRADEGAGAAVDAKVNLTITAVNDAPVAVGDVFVTAEDTTTVFTPQDLLGNDTDNDMATDADVLTITRVFAPQHCTATLNADGTISLTPETNYHGTVRFSYEVTDSQGATSTAFVVAGVNAVNDAPVAHEDSFDSLEDHIVTLNQADLLGNDTDDDIATDGDVLRVASVSNATNGQVRLLPNGQIEFVPDANFHGIATFDYVTSDSFGATSQSTVTLQVGAVNDLPVVVNETRSATEDTLYATTAASLLTNDSDVDTVTDGQLLSITQVQNAQHGVVAMDANGRITFTPDADFHGAASFEYVVSDGAGGLSTGTVTLNVQAVNDAPVTQGESETTHEDTDIVFTQAQLLANDSDVDVATDGQVLRISTVSGATNGTVTLLANGDIRFRPDANYHGPAEFTYTVSDGNGGITDAKVNLTITAVNDVPVVVDDVIAATEDTPFYIQALDLLANDSDVDVATDGQVLCLSAVSSIAGQTHGTVSLVTQADGTQQVQFTPDLNYHGVATFNYTVSDGHGGFGTAVATVNIAAVNDAPVTLGEATTGDEDTGLIFTQAQLLANDSDVDVVTDGQVLSISRVGQAEHGTVWLDAQGNLRFVPDANYHGPAQFTYWVSDGAGAETPAIVSLTVLALNDLPVVTGERVNTTEDTTLLFNPATLLANDTDIDTATDEQVLSITAVSNATHGMVAFVTQPDGSQRIAFTPEANYFGVASYQYTVSDGNGGSTVGTVVVNLAEANDAPVAHADSLSTTQEDTAMHISFASLLGNDTDADSHNSQWGGTDDVLTVSAVGNAVHGTVGLVNGEVVFTPDVNYHGPASFAYEIRDSSCAVSQAIATLTVNAVNDTPAAVGETISENEDTTLLISQAALLANDSDVDTATDGQVLRITAVSNAQHGTVTLNADGTISFVPVANFYGNASFDYTVSDGNGGQTTTTATIALANVNDAPVATGETINCREDEVLTINASALLQNDSDIDNAHADLAISRVQSGSGGTVSLNASGNVVFTPTANYNGTATFTYWVKDPSGLESNAVTATVVLAAVNDAPSAQGETVTGASEDAVFNINASTLLANDHDIDNADSELSLSWVGNASGGTVSLDANGNVVFTPTANLNGNATFEYKVRDSDGLESPVVQAVIPVAAVNDAPVAADDQLTTYTNSTMTIGFDELTGNDSDVEHDSLTVRAVRDRANGHASIVNGQVQFVANAGFRGSASFDYLADDGHGGQTWATVHVDVKEPPNQYATLNVTGLNFFSTGDTGIDVAYASWSAVDDGDATLVTFQLQQVLVSGGYYGDSWSTVQAATQYQFDATHMYVDVRRWCGFTKLQCTALLTDDRGLQNIWHFNYDLVTGHTSYADHSGYYYPPVILDLNGDGMHYTSLVDSKVAFDVNFDGLTDRMAWAGNDDGVLVWDKDHNHQITDASEFGFQTLKAGAQTDLEGLQTLDANDNGLLDAADEKFAEFAVWQDANGNGVTDAGEFRTLTELGIASINLHSNGQVHNAGTALANSDSGETDVTVMGTTVFTRIDGSTGHAHDAMLAYEAGAANQAEINRQALLFNQMCNTAIVYDGLPLGMIPIEPDVSLHDLVALSAAISNAPLATSVTTHNT